MSVRSPLPFNREKVQIKQIEDFNIYFFEIFSFLPRDQCTIFDFYVREQIGMSIFFFSSVTHVCDINVAICKSMNTYKIYFYFTRPFAEKPSIWKTYKY